MKRKIVLIFTCFLSLVVGSVLGEASENKLNFTPKINQTEHKIDDSTTDIKLKGKPGETVTLSVEVKNEDEQPIEIKTSIKDAATTSQGIVNYTSDQKVLNQELALSKLANYEDHFTLAGKEKRTIKVDIPLPKKEFPGILLGGLLIEQQPDKNNQGMIKNAFSYSLPIVIVESEETFAAELTMGEVTPELASGKNALKVSIDNPKNNLLTDGDYEVGITKKGDDKVLYHNELKKMSFAPNNRFNDYVSMAKDAYVPGDYTAHIKVTSPYGDWKWDEDFTIKDQVAKKLNKESISVEKMSTRTKVIIGLVGLLILALIAGLLRMRRQLKQVKANQE